MKNPVFLARLRAPVAFITSLSLVLSGFVSLVPTSVVLAATCTVGVNCIDNPSFELGSAGAPTGWTTNASSGAATNATFSTSTPGHTGNSAAQVMIGNSYTGGDAKWVFTAVSVTKGTYYTFSDWYKSSTTTSVFIYYTGTCSDGVSNASQGCWMIDGQASADWNYLSYGFLAPVTGTITIAHTLAGPGTLTTDDYSLVQSATAPIFNSGMVTLTFDDGWQSFWDNASSSLLANGVKATNYIITQTMTADPNCTTLAATDYHLGCYMNTAEIQALQTAGFDIDAHTRNHLDLVKDAASSTMLSLYGYADANALWTGEINNSKSDLTSAGFTPVDSFAYPYGSYNTQVEQLVHGAGFLGARSVDQGYNLESTDRYALKMQHVTNTTTAAQIEGWVQQAIADKTWLILMFHDVRSGTETQGSLNSQCVEIADNSGNSYLDASGNPLTTAPNPLPADPDCTTSKVLSDVAAYLANTTNVPTGTVKTMHEVLNGWADTIAPVIVLNGALSMTVPAGSTFVDPGVLRVTDNKDVTDPFTSAVSIGGVATTSVNTFFSGTYTIKYTATDSSANTASTTRTVIVAANTAPVATNVATSTLVSVATPITLKATDADNNTLTYSVVSNPLFGTLSGSGANLIYTPQASTTAFTDTFTFKANDGITDSNIATATIQVLLGPDVTPPLLSAITAGNPGQTAATITWTTDEAADTQVIYGIDSTYGSTSTLDTTLGVGHMVTLTGLTMNTTYHYEVISADAAGNHATSSDQTFVTAGNTNSGDSGSTSTGSSGGCGSCGGGGGGPVGLVGTTNTGLVLGASTQALTDAQIAAIINLLKSFNADQSVIDAVNASLHGQATAGTGGTTTSASDGFVFTQTLQVGSTGNQVTELQKRLGAEGLYSGPVTGYFGAMTKAAVIAYQKAHSLPQVGIVGPQTRAVLNGQI